MKRGLVRFEGYESIDAAKKLTNVKLYSNEAQTKANCTLEKGQHFWFDIMGCDVLEGEECLGKVVDIQRLADVDYLSIDTDKALVDAGLPKNFLLPYIDRYIIDADTDAKIIHVKDGKDVLEAS